MAEGQGPHMARDDVLLFSGDGEAALGIDAGRAGMGKAVHLEQAAQAPERAALVPVVEIEVMEEGPHGQHVSSAPRWKRRLSQKLTSTTFLQCW